MLLKLEYVIFVRIKGFCSSIASFLIPQSFCVLLWLKSMSVQLALHTNLLSRVDMLEEFQYLDFQQLP